MLFGVVEIQGVFWGKWWVYERLAQVEEDSKGAN